MSDNMFDKIISAFPINTKRRKLIIIIAEYMPFAVFAVYLAAALFLLFTKDALLVRFLITPLAVLIFNTVLRQIVNRKRPFEKYNFTPLIDKKGGKSFPSNHTASAFVIALACMQVNMLLGIIMLIVAVIIATSRLLVGVHYISDVFLAALIGIIGGIIGFIII